TPYASHPRKGKQSSRIQVAAVNQPLGTLATPKPLLQRLVLFSFWLPEIVPGSNTERHIAVVLLVSKRRNRSLFPGSTISAVMGPGLQTREFEQSFSILVRSTIEWPRQVSDALAHQADLQIHACNHLANDVISPSWIGSRWLRSAASIPTAD
ncbi:hypothetical protein CIHG_00388, partial [Coccidioides immitis H538.4]